MVPRRLVPFAVLSSLFVATILATTLAGSPTRVAEPGVMAALPDRAGRWVGTDILYCQKPECLAVNLALTRDGPPACEMCGGELFPASLAERNTLPEGTTLLRKRYSHPDFGRATVSIVITGQDRAGIHRPRWCLTAQGHRIESSAVIEAHLPGRSALRLMVHRISTPVNNTRGQSPRAQARAAYAYWFVGGRHETPYHRSRLFWMAYDSIVRGVQQKWAYIAIGVDRDPGSDRHRRSLQDLVASLYPLIQE